MWLKHIFFLHHGKSVGSFLFLLIQLLGDAVVGKALFIFLCFMGLSF